MPTCAQGGRCGRCARRLRRLCRVHCWRRWRRPDPRPPNVSSLLGSGGPRSPSSLTLSLPPSPQVLPPSFSPPEPELSSPPLSRRPAQRSAALRPPPAHPRPGPAGGCGPRASCGRSPVPGKGGWRGSASTPRSYPAPLFPGPRRPPALSQRPRAWAPRALPSLFRCLFTPREAPSTAQRVPRVLWGRGWVKRGGVCEREEAKKLACQLPRDTSCCLCLVSDTLNTWMCCFPCYHRSNIQKHEYEISKLIGCRGFFQI